MRILSNSPSAPTNPFPRIRVPQLRVLRCLGESRGAISKHEIARRIGCSLAAVTFAIGYSDKEAREKFERDKSGGGTPSNPNYSLLSLELVSEITYDIDGYPETVIALTAKGIKVYEQTKLIALHPVKSKQSGELE